MKITIVRHGETEWSLNGRHTGSTDLELTENGRNEAGLLGRSLRKTKFDHVFSSPLKRAMTTCELSGFGMQMKLEPSLVEWDYGDYEGLTSLEICKTVPNWSIFSKDPPNGETSKQICNRVDALLEKLKALGGDILLFSSGHISRAIAARWLGLPVSFGSYLALSTTSKSILFYEKEKPVIFLWNDTSHLKKPE